MGVSKRAGTICSNSNIQASLLNRVQPAMPKFRMLLYLLPVDKKALFVKLILTSAQERIIIF